MKALSNDLRTRIVAARMEDGQSLGVIAARFRIPKSSVQTILRHHRQTGSVKPKPHGGGRPPTFSSEALLELAQEVERHPDSTLEELRERTGVHVSLVAVHKRLKQLGFTRKKNRYEPKNNAEQT